MLDLEGCMLDIRLVIIKSPLTAMWIFNVMIYLHIHAIFEKGKRPEVKFLYDELLQRVLKITCITLDEFHFSNIAKWEGLTVT